MSSVSQEHVIQKLSSNNIEHTMESSGTGNFKVHVYQLAKGNDMINDVIEFTLLLPYYS